MKKTISISILFFLFNTTSLFAYNANDYYASHIPENMTDTIEASEDGYIPCTRLLEDFDKAYGYMSNTISMVGDGKVSPAQPIGSESVQSWAELKFYSEQEFAECLTAYVEMNAEEEAEKAALEAEEQAEKEEAEKKITDRLEAIADALIECDFDFFDDMTNSEKMDTWDEREACKNKTEEVIEPVVVPVMTTPAVKPAPAPTAPVPAYTPPVQISDIPVTNESVEDSEISTSTEATSTPEETITLTQEELDKMVDEKLNEKLEETEMQPEPEPKPSFFKRVVNFLFGWF